MLNATGLSFDSIIGESQTNADAPQYVVDANAAQIGVGGSTSSQTRANRLLVIGFALPTLDPGQVVTGARLDYVLRSGRDGSAGTGNVEIGSLDVYLLQTSNPDASGTAFFYEGTVGDEADPLTDFVGSTPEPAGINGSSDTVINLAISHDLAGDALASLQSFYTGETPNQAEAFFRWNWSNDHTLIEDIDRYRLDFGDTAVSPVLVIETAPIPEPGSALLVVGGLALITGRRRWAGSSA
ncbi:MAG: hypothetical protein AAF797_10590 [Planctomycetota bacterium]